MSGTWNVSPPAKLDGVPQPTEGTMGWIDNDADDVVEMIEAWRPGPLGSEAAYEDALYMYISKKLGKGHIGGGQDLDGNPACARGRSHHGNRQHPAFGNARGRFPHRGTRFGGERSDARRG